jgi:hypothetical protein
MAQEIGNPELLQQRSNMEPIVFNLTLTVLEMNGAITQTDSGKWIRT